jgi:hypothetical protein
VNLHPHVLAKTTAGYSWEQMLASFFIERLLNGWQRMKGGSQMFRVLLLALTICTLAACSLAAPSPIQPTPLAAPSPVQPTPLVTEVDPEEYALFSAMIDQNVVGYQRGGVVVIREQTTPNIDNLEFALEGPIEPPKELVEAYRLRNDQPYKLDHGFALNQAYELIPQPEYDSLLRGGRASWADFEAKYPQADGIFVFSRAGLNLARDEALVSMGYYCGSLCAEGGVFLMAREDGVWKVKQQLAAWMS